MVQGRLSEAALHRPHEQLFTEGRGRETLIDLAARRRAVRRRRHLGKLEGSLDRYVGANLRRHHCPGK